jgi:hypothetical protein
VKRTEATWSGRGDATAAALKSFLAAARAYQPEAASNSNNGWASNTVVKVVPPVETSRLLRAFNSVNSIDLRRTLLEFVETAAGIKHDASRP